MDRPNFKKRTAYTKPGNTRRRHLRFASVKTVNIEPLILVKRSSSISLLGKGWVNLLVGGSLIMLLLALFVVKSAFYADVARADVGNVQDYPIQPSDPPFYAPPNPCGMHPYTCSDKERSITGYNPFYNNVGETPGSITLPWESAKKLSDYKLPYGPPVTGLAKPGDEDNNPFDKVANYAPNYSSLLPPPFDPGAKFSPEGGHVYGNDPINVIVSGADTAAVRKILHSAGWNNNDLLHTKSYLGFPDSGNSICDSGSDATAFVGGARNHTRYYQNQPGIVYIGTSNEAEDLVYTGLGHALVDYTVARDTLVNDLVANAQKAGYRVTGLTSYEAGLDQFNGNSDAYLHANNQYGPYQGSFSTDGIGIKVELQKIP